MYWTNTLLFSHCYLQCRSWAGLCSSRARWPVVPNFCSLLTRKYVFFIQIICWAPWISKVQSTGLPSIFLSEQSCMGISAFTCVLIACNMADLQAKYTTCTNTRHAIHYLSLKMFENIRNISKSTANHSTL